MTETVPPQPQPTAVQLKRGVVKQVLSGDAIVLRGPPINGPPKEMTVYLSNVSAPRLGKRPTENAEGTPDEPYAWESREFLRKKVIGKDVSFFKDFTATSGREHGRIYLGDGENAENVTESAVAEGWLEVRQGTKGTDEYTQKLTELQEAAKLAKKGKWGPEEDAKNHIRDIKWTIDNPRNFVDSLKQKPQKAIIEQVRDGSTVRAMLLPDFHYITLVLSGVKAPMVRTGAEGKVIEADPFGEEARFFTESRLLQREVDIILESVSNQNFVGSILHPNGNIAEILLHEGFAKCIDWSIALATCGTEKYRAAERHAKENKLRVWKGYQPSAALSGDKKSFQAKVIEIVMGDALVVKKDTGEVLKIWLSSIRPPRQEGDSKENQTPGRQFRPLYDIPHMFDAREFLRKRLIGKKVAVTVDYVQPKSDNFPEKTACTVMIGQQNVAEALVSKGLATVVRYRQDDDNRSSHYDALLAAEAKAEKSKNGLHASKDAADKAPVVRIQELQGDANRSRQFMPYLQRAGRAEAVVEFIASGSRVRLYVAKETCIITFLLSGISCPRASRAAGPGGVASDAEPFGDEALSFTKSKCLQHEVEIEVETMDKAGNFVGYMFVPNEQGGSSNLAELLVEQGLASVHFTAERSKYYNQLIAAETRAKERRLNMWQSWSDEQAAEQAEHAAQEKQDRAINYKQVVVTDVQDTLKFAAQNFDDGPKLEKMMKDMRADFAASPPLGGAYTPRRGDICAAKFVDGQWYRAKVEAAKGPKAEVLYIDFGNRESTDSSKLAALPSIYQSMPAGAKEYSLALVQLPSEDYVSSCVAAFQQLAFGAQKLLLNIEYRNNGDFVTLMSEESDGSKTDLGKTLIEQGHALVENRRERRLQPLLTEYQEAQQKAKRDRMNIWEYGDFTGSEL